MSDSLFSKRYFYPVAGGIFCLVMACVPTILELAGLGGGGIAQLDHAEQNRHLCGAGPLAQPHPGADGPVPHGAYGLFRHGSVYDRDPQHRVPLARLRHHAHSRGAGRDLRLRAGEAHHPPARGLPADRHHRHRGNRAHRPDEQPLRADGRGERHLRHRPGLPCSGWCSHRPSASSTSSGPSPS